MIKIDVPHFLDLIFNWFEEHEPTYTVGTSEKKKEIKTKKNRFCRSSFCIPVMMDFMNQQLSPEQNIKKFFYSVSNWIIKRDAHELQTVNDWSTSIKHDFGSREILIYSKYTQSSEREAKKKVRK